MLTAWHVLTYLGAALFLIGGAVRIIRVARMPLHLRWELYPVPHEKGKAHYGGSVLEETDWWLTKREVDHWGELVVMLEEILLLKGVWEHNRSLWYASFPLHFGLYLLIGNIALLIVGGIFELSGVQLGVGSMGQVFSFLLLVVSGVGIAGGVMGLFGALFMLYKRLFVRQLRMYANAGTYLNAIFLGAIFLSALVVFGTDANAPQRLATIYAGLISAGNLPHLTLAMQWHLGICLAFAAYLPLTHMSHLFTKYFMYHDIRWEDTPNTPGGKLEDRIAAQVNQKVSWAAPHIQGGGTKTWVDVATSTGAEDDK
ncbi:hypothetical protein KQI63_17010 [bacterium]|nr:hypothetical protein [bacterium]